MHGIKNKKKKEQMGAVAMAHLYGPYEVKLPYNGSIAKK